MSSTPKPGIGPLPKVASTVGLSGTGGFHALESWLYDHDYVDLERRRAAFLGARRKSMWFPDPRECTAVEGPPAVRRAAPHTPAGVPTLVRELGRRRIHISCEYRHVNEKAAPKGGLSRV